MQSTVVLAVFASWKLGKDDNALKAQGYGKEHVSVNESPLPTGPGGGSTRSTSNS